MLSQDDELEASLSPPPFEMLTEAYFVSGIEFLVETTDITKRIPATHDQSTRRPTKQNRRALPQLE
jgi:hypothetical protein